MANNKWFGRLLGTALMLGSEIALGGSTFQFVLDPGIQAVSPSGLTSATLVLRETFDGTGNELFDSTDGPGLFSFSVSISQGTSTSGIPATIDSVSLDTAFFPAVSSVDLHGPVGAHTGVDLSGAIGLLTPPGTDGPATGVAGTFDVPIATLNLNTSSSLGDTTSFLSSSHPMASFLTTLDATGAPINITYGFVSQLSTVPEPAGQRLLALAAVTLGLVRRRRLS